MKENPSISRLALFGFFVICAIIIIGALLVKSWPGLAAPETESPAESPAVSAQPAQSH